MYNDDGGDGDDDDDDGDGDDGAGTWEMLFMVLAVVEAISMSL